MTVVPMAMTSFVCHLMASKSLSVRHLNSTRDEFCIATNAVDEKIKSKTEWQQNQSISISFTSANLRWNVEYVWLSLTPMLALQYQCCVDILSSLADVQDSLFFVAK